VRSIPYAPGSERLGFPSASPFDCAVRLTRCRSFAHGCAHGFTEGFARPAHTKSSEMPHCPKVYVVRLGMQAESHTRFSSARFPGRWQSQVNPGLRGTPNRRLVGGAPGIPPPSSRRLGWDEFPSARDGHQPPQEAQARPEPSDYLPEPELR
jgi:hypothetical protein